MKKEIPAMADENKCKTCGGTGEVASTRSVGPEWLPCDCQQETPAMADDTVEAARRRLSNTITDYAITHTTEWIQVETAMTALIAAVRAESQKGFCPICGSALQTK